MNIAIRPWPNLRFAKVMSGHHRVEKKEARKLYLFIIFFCFISAPAYAYVDPSVGSLWIQSLVAIFAITGTALRLYWNKLKQLFSRKNKLNLKKNKNKFDDK